MTTIVLADDHQVVRVGLRTILSDEADFVVVGEAKDGLEASELVERLRPDVLVVDLMMPGLNGLQVVERAVQRSPATRIIILSIHANEAYVLQALQKGAFGYVLKDSTDTDLVQAVREVVAGRLYLSPPLSDRAIRAYALQAAPTALDFYDRLTPREQEVFHLTAEGATIAEIASRLTLKPAYRGSTSGKFDAQAGTAQPVRGRAVR